VSFSFSLTKYDMLSAPKWKGLGNYIQLFGSDQTFWTALTVTFSFVLVSVPLKLAFALFIALLFKNGFKGVGVYRTIFYAPSIIGGSVAVAVMWRQLFSMDGAVNGILRLFGIPVATNWIANPHTALWTLILLVVWQFGSPMLIFLAGLKQIPRDLYEAAEVDGAGRMLRFFNITLPLLTPIIFFNLVMQIIGGFMTFTQSYLITAGGPLNSTLFYAVYLYRVAFTNFEMGYASAMAWVLLFIIALITLFVFKTASSWVFYESEGGNE
jgi:multiple sugar transport system permease protein